MFAGIERIGRMFVSAQGEARDRSGVNTRHIALPASADTAVMSRSRLS